MDQNPDKARLEALQRQLDELKRVHEKQRHDRPGTDGGYGQGMRFVTELLAGVVGGVLIGWLLDRWLGTEPWLLLVMLFLGIAASFRNIFRQASGSKTTRGPDKMG